MTLEFLVPRIQPPLYQVSSFSLQSLLEYNKTDKKERVFEVAIFAGQ